MSAAPSFPTNVVTAAALPVSMTAGELQAEIQRLSQEVDYRADELAQLEIRLLEKRVRDRLLPSMVPVKDAFLGSPFGHRADPVAGLRAMHEGIDFNAVTGTPVVAAAGGSAVCHVSPGVRYCD